MTTDCRFAKSHVGENVDRLASDVSYFGDDLSLDWRFYQLEEDARRLDYIVGGCERIFSSPLPPTMARHIVRCLQLWLLGFPFVLAGTMAPLSVALWVLATSYALVGIDEVGVQVEQPFDIIPMNKMCMIVMWNLNETFVNLPRHVRERMGMHLD